MPWQPKYSRIQLEINLLSWILHNLKYYFFASLFHHHPSSISSETIVVVNEYVLQPPPFRHWVCLESSRGGHQWSIHRHSFMVSNVYSRNVHIRICNMSVPFILRSLFSCCTIHFISVHFPHPAYYSGLIFEFLLLFHPLLLF